MELLKGPMKRRTFIKSVMAGVGCLLTGYIPKAPATPIAEVGVVERFRMVVSEPTSTPIKDRILAHAVPTEILGPPIPTHIARRWVPYNGIPDGWISDEADAYVDMGERMSDVTERLVFEQLTGRKPDA